MTTTYRFGLFELQPNQRRLLMDGRPVELGHRAFDVLLVLVERAGQLVTKDELLEIWGLDGAASSGDGGGACPAGGIGAQRRSVPGALGRGRGQFLCGPLWGSQGLRREKPGDRP